MSAAPPHPELWWRGAAIYQIYPRSFADTTGNGVGDLPGITAHLDHVASLGVDAIWLSPFFPSPMADFGYDVSDFRAVDPMFGTLDDFDRLVDRAHALGLKVVIDQVYAHTSDVHAWFAESRADRGNARADWYVWADPQVDGTPPNNWQSVFGGPAWTWDARRRQYYMHNFLARQPQLNLHSPAVQGALLDVARFWLDRGVDGFRLDAINFGLFDACLTDNPPAPDDGTLRTRPSDYQRPLHNRSQPGIVGFLERVRVLTDAYPDRFTVAEVGGVETDAEMKRFTDVGRLDTAYGFDFLYADALTPALVRDTLAKWEESGPWPSWAFENHDVPRAISRWSGTADRTAMAAAKMLLLACLRGNIFLYQGEELGLTQVDVPQAMLRDPEAIANWPLTLSRDGARTPMPWRHDAPGLGFSGGAPWLPFGADHAARAVDLQEADPASLLHLTRACLALRRAHPALRLGSWTLLHADAALLAFERAYGDERLLCLFNLAGGVRTYEPGSEDWEIVRRVGGGEGWRLHGIGGLVARVHRS